MGEALTIRVRREQGYAIVAVAGEVDIATVTRLRERLFGLAASGSTLVVDLDQVSFIDSAGLASLPNAPHCRFPPYLVCPPGESAQIAGCVPQRDRLGP